MATRDKSQNHSFSYAIPKLVIYSEPQTALDIIKNNLEKLSQLHSKLHKTIMELDHLGRKRSNGS